MRVTNGVWDPNRERASVAAPTASLPATNQARDGSKGLPATGGAPALPVAVAVLGLWVCVRLVRRVVHG